MTTISTSTTGSYAGYIADAQAQIATIQKELSTGQKTLSAADQSTVTNLSAKATAYAAVDKSVADAQSLISKAQSGLTSITALLNRMSQMAAQATTTGADNAISFNFQQLLTEAGKLTADAGLNGHNLLSGTAGLFVQTGTDGTPAAQTFVPSVNFYGVVTFGVLSGIGIDTPTKASQAVDALRTALANVVSSQYSLGVSAKQLTAKVAANDQQKTQAEATVASLKNVDKAKLQAQLTALQSKVDVYTLLNSM